MCMYMRLYLPVINTLHSLWFRGRSHGPVSFGTNPLLFCPLQSDVVPPTQPDTQKAENAPYYYCYGSTYSGCTAYKTLPAQRAGDMQASTIRPAAVGLLGMRTPRSSPARKSRVSAWPVPMCTCMIDTFSVHG